MGKYINIWFVHNHKSKRKFATWKQILQAGVGVFKPLILYTDVNIPHHTAAILILEHSFYLFQQKDPQPAFSAVQKYKASNTPARVSKALEDVFKQYNKASENEKVDIVLNVIIQNRMGELPVDIFSTFDNSISEL